MPRSQPQSALRYPLTDMLGAEANVRVLRELAQHGGLLSAPSLVMRTGLAQSSVREALIALEGSGIVQSEGSGRARLFRISSAHPLSDAVVHLFRAEEERFDAILASIRSAAEHAGQEVVAVWIYGSVARGRDHAASDLDIAVVAEADTLSELEAGLRRALEEAEQRQAFTASVIAISPQDLMRLADEADPWWIETAQHHIPIFGDAPMQLVARLRGSSQRRRRAAR